MQPNMTDSNRHVGIIPGMRPTLMYFGLLKKGLMISAPPRHLCLHSISESVSSVFDVFFLRAIM